jgi:cytochrome d ubiquinol oxidase subunit I
MRTADASSPVAGGSVAFTLALFLIAYAVVFSFGIYYINRLIARGLGDAAAKAIEPLGSASPIAAAQRD